MIALRCSGLVKKYQDTIAVNGLDLEVRTGECFGLLGPNGAGKTTTVEILEGLIRPDQGIVEVLGQSWDGGPSARRLRERLGVALQETRLADRLNVEETIRLFRSFYTNGRSVEEMLNLLGLKEKRRTWVEKLSGGQRQRLALACALIGAPELLFLDEPTTGLDPQARLAIWEVVEDFQKRGCTVLITTHYMEEAEHLCDRVGIMDHGRLIALDTPDALIESLSAGQILELGTDGPLAGDPLLSVGDVHIVAQQEELITLRIEHLERMLPLILSEVNRQGAVIHSLKTRQTTLEDVFVHLTGRALRDE
ncbi:MAG: ABC transporter ATP-binding protein [Proteobacteria bacterium]|nr:ABC transporter ATP-binding protein [Pseudomonadota bacterium]